MKNRILFFSNVNNIELFKLTGFYVEDIKVLEGAGFIVNCTNKKIDFIRFWNYDIAFLYFYKTSFLAAILARLTFKKIIYSGGNDELSPNVITNKYKRYIFEILFKTNYLFSSICNVVSKNDFSNMEKVLEKFPKQSANKLSYFPHSIDTVKYARNHLYAKENIITSICWMSSIRNVKRKGLDKTIICFKKIKEAYPNYKLYLIGNKGIGSEYLENIVEKEDLKDSVTFTGPLSEEEKLDLLNRSKYYFQLSSYEGFGIAVIEAMMLHNFIFHTGKGALNETIGRGGYMIEDINDCDKLIEFISHFENNSSIYRDRLEKNRKFVMDNYSRESRSKYFKSEILKLFTK